MNLQNIPNKGFMFIVLGLLALGELYNFKENFKPYRYDGIYDRYFDNKDLLHIPESSSDRKGLKCSLEKNVIIKGIQDNKFREYKDLKKEMNEVLYGNKPLDEVKMPQDLGNIDNEMEKIGKVREIMCPPVCHLIKDKNQCNESLDLRVQLPNNSQFNTTRPVFNDKYMMDQAYECLNINNPSSDSDCGANCKFNENLNKCVYDVRKCVFDESDDDESNHKCRKKCMYYDREGNCPTQYCNWDSDESKCLEKN